MGGFGQGSANANWGGFGGGQQWDFSGFQNGEGFDMGDLGDIFGDFFGGGMGRGGRGGRKGRDLSVEIKLTFEESIFGVAKEIILNKQSVCDGCDGTGAEKGTKLNNCKTCNGQGKVREVRRSILGNFATTKTCDNCNGTGRIPDVKCSDCRGSGIRKKEEKIKVNIPAGINPGEMVKMTSMGEAIQGGKTGDLYIKVNIAPHPVFKRQNLNLVMELPIKLSDSLLGMTYKLKTLEGNIIEVKIPEGIKHGELLRVRGKGVPSNLGRGDIILHISVNVPNRLSRRAKELIDELKKEGI
jgi:molecular chaperone DnaJ